MNNDVYSCEQAVELLKKGFRMKPVSWHVKSYIEYDINDESFDSHDGVTYTVDEMKYYLAWEIYYPVENKKSTKKHVDDNSADENLFGEGVSSYLRNCDEETHETETFNFFKAHYLCVTKKKRIRGLLWKKDQYIEHNKDSDFTMYPSGDYYGFDSYFNKQRAFEIYQDKSDDFENREKTIIENAIYKTLNKLDDVIENYTSFNILNDKYLSKKGLIDRLHEACSNLCNEILGNKNND